MKKVFLFAVLVGMLSCKQTNTTITPTDGSSTTFAVTKGTSFKIDLPIGSSPSSTGVVWQLITSPDARVVSIDSVETIQNPQGASYWGTQVWHLKAITTGSASLQFNFARATNVNEAYDKKSFIVTIVN